MSAKALLESLPVVDIAQCAVVHVPVYDCGSDLFERACRHQNYRWGYDAEIGCADGDRMRKLIERAEGEDGAIVPAGDYLYVLLADSVQQPGGVARFIVRVQDDEYFTWWWRTGMRPSAQDADPPFYVRDVRKNPQLWLDRVERLHGVILSNEQFKRYRGRCEHGVGLE
jgi:hypothetical protein